ncbi:MAG: sulfatase-like hydrolase/transferase [Acidobacteriaceae bacterium]
MSPAHPTQSVIAEPRLKALARTVFVALGFTTIFLLWLIRPAVDPTQQALYHWSGNVADFFVPIAIDFLGTLLVLILLLWALRSPGRGRVLLWSALLFFIPWFALTNLEIIGLANDHELGRILFLSAFLAAILLTIRWRPAFANRFESVVTWATTVLIFVGIFGAFLLCRLAWYGRQASLLQTQFPLLHAQIEFPPKPNRIIWIILDELSYQQTYERRYPGLQLPAFDAFANDATSFTDAIPPAIYTQTVLPGLLEGKPFDQIHTSSLARLSVHDPSTGSWQPFDPYNTVFSDAFDARYNTAIAGWFNPYCRLLSPIVNRCFWTYRPVDYAFGIVPSGTILSNALAPIQMMITRMTKVGPFRIQSPLLHLLHIPLEKPTRTLLQTEDYQALDVASLKLLRNSSAGFVLLHLPVPHPWGIYNRHTGKFTTASSSYINNLALADKCLAGIRKTLEDTGQWNSSTVLVMGDHSWRTKQLWRLSKVSYAWSQEDEDASHGGQYDPRPAYLVKLPNQTTPALINAPYRTFRTRQLFDKIMAHQITTPADLVNWVRSLPAAH